MGCFPSTNKLPRKQNNSSFDSERAPPQPLPLLEIQEEKVKEVLSETPAVKPKIQSDNNAPKIQQENTRIVEKKSDVLHISEICKNMYQRIPPTVGTTDGTESRRRTERSPIKTRNQIETGKSPARRPEPSPGRVRLTPGRERLNVRDGGESSGRKTMSPARYTDGGSNRYDLGRSPSMTKTGKSPNRIRPERNSKVEGSKRRPTTNESLENPFVSLECFIFL